MSAKSKATPVSFELVKREPDVALHNLFHRRGLISTAQGVCWLVLCGLQLESEKAALDHGQWEPWVESKCEFNIRTVQRYMKLANGVKARALKTTDASFFRLLESSPADLTPKQQEQLIAGVQKMTDGETISDLYLGFGIVKSPAAAGLREKKRKHTPSTADPNDPAEVAKDLWAPHLDFLEADGLETRSWMDLPGAELTRLKEAVADLGRLLKCPSRTGGGKK